MTSPSPMKSPDRDAADEVERVAMAMFECEHAYVGSAPTSSRWTWDMASPEIMGYWRKHARVALDASELATLRRRVAELEGQLHAERYARGALNAVRTAAIAPRRCPTCNSPDPKRHPAVQSEGEVHICPDEWHGLPPGRNEG